MPALDKMYELIHIISFYYELKSIIDFLDVFCILFGGKGIFIITYSIHSEKLDNEWCVQRP